MVVVIKQGKELYIVQSSFFARKMGLVRDDHNCPRSKHNDLIQKVGRELIYVPTETAAAVPVRCSADPFLLYDVALKGKRRRFNLSVYFIHVDQLHTVTVNKHCVYLADHPLNSLLRKRAEQSRIVGCTKTAVTA